MNIALRKLNQITGGLTRNVMVVFVLAAMLLAGPALGYDVKGERLDGSIYAQWSLPHETEDIKSYMVCLFPASGKCEGPDSRLETIEGNEAVEHTFEDTDNATPYRLEQWVVYWNGEGSHSVSKTIKPLK